MNIIHNGFREIVSDQEKYGLDSPGAFVSFFDDKIVERWPESQMAAKTLISNSLSNATKMMFGILRKPLL